MKLSLALYLSSQILVTYCNKFQWAKNMGRHFTYELYMQGVIWVEFIKQKYQNFNSKLEKKKSKWTINQLYFSTNYILITYTKFNFSISYSLPFSCLMLTKKKILVMMRIRFHLSPFCSNSSIALSFTKPFNCNSFILNFKVIFCCHRRPWQHNHEIQILTIQWQDKESNLQTAKS